MNQMTIDFTPGITEQFPAFMDCVRSSVYGCGRAFKSIAADLDMSVSELSRKIGDNPNDNVHFPLHRLADLIAATGDRAPVYWLLEKFLEDADVKRKRALDEIPGLVQALQAAMQKSGLRAVA